MNNQQEKIFIDQNDNVESKNTQENQTNKSTQDFDESVQFKIKTHKKGQSPDTEKTAENEKIPEYLDIPDKKLSSSQRKAKKKYLLRMKLLERERREEEERARNEMPHVESDFMKEKKQEALQGKLPTSFILTVVVLLLLFGLITNKKVRAGITYREWFRLFREELDAIYLVCLLLLFLFFLII